MLLKRIIKNFVSVLMGNISSKLIGLITAIILARYLGPEEYGQYSFVISFAYIFLVCSEFGTNELIVKNVAPNLSLAPKSFIHFLLFRILFSIISIMILNLTVYALGYSTKVLYCTLIFSTHIIFLAVINEVISFFKAFEKMEFVGVILILNGIIGLGLILIVVFSEASLYAVIVSRVGTYILGAGVGIYFLKKYLFHFEIVTHFNLWNQTIKAALPFFLINLSDILYYKIDILILSKLKGDIFVGWYSIVANDLFFGFFAIAVSLSTVMFPIYIKNYQESAKDINNSINFTIRIGIILGMGLSLGCFILAPSIITLIFGKQYLNSVIIMQILSLAILFLFLREPLGFALVAVCGARKMMNINMILLLLNAILNFIFIHLWGHIGAAITMTICIILSFIWIYLEVKKKVKQVEFLKPGVKTLMGTILMGIIIYFFLEINIVVGIAIGSAVYLANVFCMKIISATEINKIMNLIRKDKT